MDYIVVMVVMIVSRIRRRIIILKLARFHVHLEALLCLVFSVVFLKMALVSRIGRFLRGLISFLCQAARFCLIVSSPATMFF